MNEPRELVLLSKACRALSDARTVDEVKDLRDKAAAVKAYIKKAKLGHHLVVEAATIKLRAERKLGQMLQALDLARSAPGNQHTGPQEPCDGTVLLRDLGISKADSCRSQRIASLPDDVFERYVIEKSKAGREPTLAGLFRLTKQCEARNHLEPEVEQTGKVAQSMQDLFHGGFKFSTIYADPPWGRGNKLSDTSITTTDLAMTVDDLCSEPVEKVCKSQAHLHLWTTNAFLLDALDVIDAWGFTYKSSLIWVKPQNGRGRYWLQ
jgi:hypothetical protein